MAATGESLTYAQLDEAGSRIVSRLSRQFGIRKGDRIAVLSEWSLDYVSLFVAAMKQGFILVPLNYRLSSHELAYILKDSSPSLAIADEGLEPLLKESIANSKIETRHVPVSWLSQDSRVDAAPPSEIEGDDPVFILYTSGTTGFPKGALYTHQMMLWNSINTAMSLELHSESRTINCMPPFHTGGWNVLLSPLLHHGGYLCLMKKFDAEKLVGLIETEQPTLLMAVPTMLAMMADTDAFKDLKGESLKYMIVGGEAMPVPLIHRWHQKGIPIRQGYGMTEAGPNLTSLHQKDSVRKSGSIGFPNFYVSTRIVDESGEDCLPGTAGELWINGPMVTPGYWKNPEATRQNIRNGWLNTGDVVVEDEEGYLFVVDRTKNMYISGGENVYPAEVERVIGGLDGIRECAIIGVPHPVWGETGVAFLVSETERKNEEISEAVRSHCLKHLAKFKVPMHYRILESLPRNATGKIDRNSLRDQFQSA